MNDLSLIEAEYGDLSGFRDCAPFWIPVPELAQPTLDSLKQAKLRTIGQSAGGREIIAIEYGEKESLDTTSCNLMSSMAGGVGSPDPTGIYPASFFGDKRREKPVVVLQGGIHGAELTGTVASLNLCVIIETGKDLRGREWPKLAELARKTRLCIIPWLGPDGTARWPLWNPTGATLDLYGTVNQGIQKDGTKYRYPKVKNIFPIPKDQTAFMGCYYNDNGVNLQYDFTTVHRQPETTAWMEYYLDERPDGVAIFHCNGGSMLGPTEYFIPEGYQFESSRLAGAVDARLNRDGIKHGRLSWAALPGMGTPGVNQLTATYMVSGALPILVELPAGTKEYDHTLDDLLDIGLITIEEILFYAHTDGLRANEVWTKVQSQLRKAEKAANAD